MAAPMQQMPGGLMPQQQNRFGGGNLGPGMDFSQFAFQFINSAPYVGPGWQTTVAISERVGKAHELITSAVLATPGQPWQRLAHLCVQFEQNAFRESPDKVTYDHKMRQKSAEMHARRQGQVPQLQESMNAQAAQQRQQQMMMMNQRQQQQQAALLQAQMAGRGGGPNQTGGFHQLQNPMQLSQLPQQAPQMGLSLSNGMNPQMNPGQAGFSMPQGPQRGPDQQQLSDADKQRIQALAQNLMQQASEAQKQQMMQNLAQRLDPQRLAQMRAQGQNPLAVLFQQEATKRFMLARRNQMQQKQGMPPNTPGMQMQPGQQRQMNPNMMNNMGQQGGQMGPYGNNMESIMNEQKQGLLAEQAGQLVVPASSGPGRNATPQPLTGMQSQNMFSQGQNQTPQPQMPNGFNLQQQQMKQQMAASHAQAQLRAAQAKGLQGQPGGLSGPMPASQSPAMDNLNAPVRQPPVAMGQMGVNQGQPGNPQFGQGLDPRFNQPGGPGQMPGNPNMPQDPAIRQMLSQLDPQQREKFRQLPPEKLNELFSKWKRTGMLRPGQMQQGAPMNQANPNNAANPMGNAMHQQPQGGMGPQMQQANLQNPMNRFRGGNPLQHPQAQMIMDNMDLPPQVTQLIPGIPPDAKKWGQFKAWVSQTNAGIPDQQKQMLRNIQLGQFKRMVMSHGQAGGIGVPQQPGAPNANPLGNLPPNTPIPDVTPQEIQQFRMSQQNFRDAPEEQIKMFIQRLKIQRMRQAMGMVGQPQPTTTVGAQPGALPIASGPQQGMQPGQGVSAPASAPEPSQTPVTAGPQANRPPQPNMVAPPNNSAASQPKNNLKRSSDDLEAPTQPNANDQRPASQSVQLPAGNIPTFTPEQIAKMTPEARQRYEAMRNQNQSPEMARFRTICQEELKSFEAQRFPEIPMTADMRNQLAIGIGKILQEINKYAKAINPWFRATRDEARLRAFLKTRMRVMNQYHPNNNNKEPPALKENLTMNVQDISQAQALCQSIHKDLASIQRGARPPQPGGPATSQPAAQPQQPQQAQQPQRTEQPGSNQVPTPLNEANLAKQTQALNKAHQRSNSKSGQPPAAPTSSQPPFPLGAASPDGKPLWVAQTPLTQEKLQLPSARKKIKTGNQASSPAVSSQNASPQTKVTSPDLKKKEPKAAPKPAFMCTEPGCEMAETGFPTEEARKQHHQEVHVLPYEDPQQFMHQSFAAAFGLDEQGQPKPQTQSATEEAAAMSREASAKQQGGAPGAPSTQGARAGDNKAAATGPKPGDKSMSEQVASGFQQSQAVDPLANTTIDPQSLMAPMMHLFDPAAGGVISDMTLYQSTTPPEDTPESSGSKDSGTSEPNSDIPETANLEIDMNWTNFDDSTLVNGMAAFGMDMELNSFEGMASFPNDDMLITEDMLVDMDKPFTGLDPSLYELNTF